jgi:hypothetical protein
MKPASIHEIRQQLSQQSHEELMDLLLRLARFKQENKALLSYQLFDAVDEDAYISQTLAEIRDTFVDINPAPYLAKKTIRKAIRMVNRSIKYSGKPATEVALLLGWMESVFQSEVKIHASPVILNLIKGIFKRAQKAFDLLHEDLQYEYRGGLEKSKQCLEGTD